MWHFSNVMDSCFFSTWKNAEYGEEGPAAGWPVDLGDWRYELGREQCRFLQLNLEIYELRINQRFLFGFIDI
jgi:hypothetical protein